MVKLIFVCLILSTCFCSKRAVTVFVLDNKSGSVTMYDVYQGDTVLHQIFYGEPGFHSYLDIDSAAHGNVESGGTASNSSTTQLSKPNCAD